MNISVICKTKTSEEERAEKERTLNRKKEIFLKMKQQNKKLQKNNNKHDITNNTENITIQKDIHTINKLKAQYNTLLTERKKLQKQNHKLQERLQRKTQECITINKKQERKIIELKNQIQTMYKIIEENKMQKETIVKLQRQIKYWEEYNVRNSILKLRKKIDGLNQIVREKRRLCQHYVQEIQNLNAKLAKMKEIDFYDTAKQYKKRYITLNLKYNKLLQNQRLYMSIKSSTRTITSLINANNNLKQVNWKLATYIQQHKIMNYISYFLSFYNNPYAFPEANKESITKASANNNQANIVQIRKPHYMFKGLVETIQITKQDIIYKDDYINRCSTKFGHIEKEDDVSYFCSTSGKKYIINNHEIVQQYKNGTPCRARAFNGKATITKFYVSNNQKKGNTIDAIKKQKGRNKRGIKFNNQLFDYYAKQFKDISVLIVGYKYKTTYTTILTRCGLNVIWCDPFKYKQDSLLDKYRQCDVAILCADHMSHAILDRINIYNNPKAQLMHNDTVYRILSRVKYALIQMNKL